MEKPLNFLLCPSYHGATLISLLINNHSRTTCLGDTLPTRAHMDFYCSCTSTIENCEFWQHLSNELKTERFTNERHLIPITPRLREDFLKNARLTTKFTWYGRKFGINPWVLTPRKSREFVEVTEELASVACEFHGTDVFVDGAKTVNRVIAYLMIAKPQQLRVIHVIRDPRAYIHSSLKNNPEDNPNMDVAISDWNSYHRHVLEIIKPMQGVDCLSVRYEDLCADPDQEMRRIFDFLELENEKTTIPPMEPHHLIGNRMLVGFDGSVELDTRWESAMDSETQQEILEKTAIYSQLFDYH